MSKANIKDLEKDETTKTVAKVTTIPIPGEKLTVEITPTKVDGVPCLSISEFAFLMGWTPQNVYYHINHEDPNRRIKAKKVFRSLFVIPYSEYEKLSKRPED